MLMSKRTRFCSNWGLEQAKMQVFVGSVRKRNKIGEGRDFQP